MGRLRNKTFTGTSLRRQTGSGRDASPLKGISAGCERARVYACRNASPFDSVYRRIRRGNPKFWPSDEALGSYSGPEVTFEDPNAVRGNWPAEFLLFAA